MHRAVALFRSSMERPWPVRRPHADRYRQSQAHFCCPSVASRELSLHLSVRMQLLLPKMSLLEIFKSCKGGLVVTRRYFEGLQRVRKGGKPSRTSEEGHRVSCPRYVPLLRSLCDAGEAVFPLSQGHPEEEILLSPGMGPGP